jgi:Protein phosphatase 2C
LKLIAAVTQGSGPVNEDGCGYLGSSEDVSAAWIFDGVTGINGRNYLPAETDAAWFVDKAHKHLLGLAALDIPLSGIISRLVGSLIADWDETAKSLDLPANYDPPAACLILAKRYVNTWQAVRLGDACLLAKYVSGKLATLAASPNNTFEQWLTKEAAKRRDEGMLDVKALLAEFRPQLIGARKLRNTPAGYSILEANTSAAKFAEYINLGEPDELLLCTDGYYRAVDYYSQFSDDGLLAASAMAGGVDQVLHMVRAIEASDPECQKHLRFKPADDATAVMMRRL